MFCAFDGQCVKRLTKNLNYLPKELKFAKSGHTVTWLAKKFTIQWGKSLLAFIALFMYLGIGI